MHEKGPPTIGRCPPGLRRAALELVWNDLPADFRAQQIAAAQFGDEQPAALPRDVVLIASRRGQVTAATLARLQVGHTAIVYPPRGESPTGEADRELAARLLAALLAEIDAAGAQVAQALLIEGDPTCAEQASRDASLLTAAGFGREAELLYLSCQPGAALLGDAVTTGALTFVPHAGEQPDRLGPLIEATYEATLDCPRLNGRRDMADILASFRGSVGHAPEWWFLIFREDQFRQRQEVGCLILADDATSQQSELMYMGIAPRFRGQGLGREIVRHAQRLAAARQRRQLLLAVDAANWPAIAMYEQCGFAEFTRRAVYLRFRN